MPSQKVAVTNLPSAHNMYILFFSLLFYVFFFILCFFLFFSYGSRFLILIIYPFSVLFLFRSLFYILVIYIYIYVFVLDLVYALKEPSQDAHGSTD